MRGPGPGLKAIQVVTGVPASVRLPPPSFLQHGPQRYMEAIHLSGAEEHCDLHLRLMFV
jgi:hypothetical protein